MPRLLLILIVCALAFVGPSMVRAAPMPGMAMPSMTVGQHGSSSHHPTRPIDDCTWQSACDMCCVMVAPVAAAPAAIEPPVAIRTTWGTSPLHGFGIPPALPPPQAPIRNQ